MKKFLAIAVISLLSYSAQAQEKVSTEDALSFASYEMQIKAKKADLAELAPPTAVSDCELEDAEINYTFTDVTFSGGKYGTLERTWIAEDACGNKAKTVQFIALTD
jgi:hypothetical protein